jgi:flagellar biosynthesis/type III secretory pathway protein FliH
MTTIRMTVKNLKTAWMMLAVATLLITTGGSILAQPRNRDRYPEQARYSEREIRQTERNGYEYGIRDGRRDGQNGDRYNPEPGRAIRDRRDSSWGYRSDSRYGNSSRDELRDAFRNGYLDGYRNGYRQSFDNHRGRRNERGNERDRYQRRW